MQQISASTAGLSARQRLLAIGMVSAMLIGGLAVLAPAPSADAYYVYPKLTWTQYSTTTQIYGYANGRTYWCGLSACGEWNNVYSRTSRQSGASVSKSRTSPSMKINGIAVSVSVPAGLGFSVSGTTCHAGWWSASGGWVSVSFGSQAVCKGSSLVAITGGSYTVAGGTLVGSNWTARTATAS